MFQTAPGVFVPFPEKIHEQFQVYEEQLLRANVSFEKLRPLILDFCHRIAEPLFFVLQLPLTLQEEKQYSSDTVLHQAVYYMDGQTRQQIEAILNSYGKILLADGLCQFAVASHATHEELFVRKYKLIDIYSNSPRRFAPLLQQYGLTETDRLLTAWDTFSQETPGRCSLISIEGQDVYGIAEQLKEKGMYQAKIIED